MPREKSMNELRADYFYMLLKFASLSSLGLYPRQSQFRAKCHKHDDDGCLQGAIVELRYLSPSSRIAHNPVCFMVCFHSIFGTIRRKPLMIACCEY